MTGMIEGIRLSPLKALAAGFPERSSLPICQPQDSRSGNRSTKTMHTDDTFTPPKLLEHAISHLRQAQSQIALFRNRTLLYGAKLELATSTAEIETVVLAVKRVLDLEKGA